MSSPHPRAGRLVDRIAPCHVTTAALSGMLAGLALLLTLRSDTPLWLVITTVCVLGIAMGFNTPAVMKLALGAVPPDRLGAGTGLFSTLRDLGSPTGSSVSLAVFSASLAFHNQQGSPDALAAALGTVGWLLVALIGIALRLSLRLQVPTTHPLAVQSSAFGDSRSS
ncbi:MFS transporter [Aromatoleum diolicum]|uniref:MFS transporter n=1 Tax=Aromatoleum diolicum TaxID=75796 RepID=UPI0031B62860